MKQAVRTAAIVAALAGACAARAQGAEYIYDIIQTDRGIMPAWSAIVPARFARQPWIKAMEGVTFPVERPQIDGKAFYLGAICMPHHCAGNHVVFLIALDHSAAYGLLRSLNLEAQDTPFGEPGEEALRIMKEHMGKQEQ